MSAPVSEPAFRYSAFLSYSHRDERWARRLQNALESYRVPLHLAHAQRGVAGRRLSPVFRDRTDLPSATDLGAHIREALQDSANLIVICSPDAGASRWVNEEIRYFRSLGRDDRIFCLIVGGEPNASDLPGRESEECFPAALRFLDGPDGPATGPRVEPIAADARPGADGKSNAQLKLIAGLLGVGFDELKQRELRRQQRRLLVVTVASLAGVLVTGTLAISAWFARQDAIRNRDRAEDLISFMLGDFRQQLEPLGKLELLKSVGDKAMAYFESQDARDITNESLLRRAEALRQIGDVRLSLGEFEPALAAFEESLSLSRELSRRSPDNKDWLFALGNAWFWVGYTHWQKGDLDAAAAPMNEYFRAAERLVQLKPDDPRWQLELGYALANLGSLAAARGDGQAAIRYFESGNAIAEKLIQDDPADLGLLLTRIENHSWLASIHQGLGELREAKVLHAKALQFATELLESRPDDRRIQREKVLRQVFLSRVLVSLGELEEAGRVSGDALSAARVLSSVDPENARWQWQLASVMEQEVRVLRARGRCGEAAAMAEAGLAVTRDLAETATDMDLGHLTRLRLLSEKAACLFDAGRLEEADRALLPLLQFPRVPDERSVNVVHYEIVLATGRHLAGQIMAAKGRMDSARQLWTAGLGILSAGQTDPAHRAVRAMLLEDLGRAEEARQLAAELSELGYSEPNFTRQMFGSDPSA